MKPEDAIRLKPGTPVAFVDGGNVLTAEDLAACEGVVNGEPVLDEREVCIAVPVWAERDNGREATTIFVAVANLLGRTST